MVTAVTMLPSAVARPPTAPKVTSGSRSVLRLDVDHLGIELHSGRLGAGRHREHGPHHGPRREQVGRDVPLKEGARHQVGDRPVLRRRRVVLAVIGMEVSACVTSAFVGAVWAEA